MAQLTLPCPHCRAEKVGFAARGFCSMRPGQSPALLFLQCEGCGEGLVAIMPQGANSVQYWISGSMGSPGPIQRTYPELVALKAPADIPDNVRTPFLSGLDNLSRPLGASAAAMMFRRAIELAVKNLNPSAPAGDNLKKRIDSLGPNIATPAMKDWAHSVRLDGNEAAHDQDEFTEADAKELHVFAEMFLTYAFTLPAALVRARTPGGSPPPS